MFAFALGVGYYIGMRATTLSYELKISNLNAVAQQTELDNQAKQIQLESEWQKKLDDAQQKAYVDKQNIDANYKRALADIMLNAESGSTDTTTLSNDTDTATRTTANSKCGCSNKNLRTIKANLLMIARDCDITATHYNELLGIYQGLQ